MAGPCICCLCAGDLYSTNLISSSSMASVRLPSLISWFFSSIRLITIILASSYVSLYLVIAPYLLNGVAPELAPPGTPYAFAAQEHSDWLAASRIFIDILNHVLTPVKPAIPWNESFPFVQPASTSALVFLGFSSLFSSRFVFLCTVIR